MLYYYNGDVIQLINLSQICFLKVFINNTRNRLRETTNGKKGQFSASQQLQTHTKKTNRPLFFYSKSKLKTL